MGKNKNYPQEVRNMGFYLGSAAPKALYRSQVKSPYFVDKSIVLKDLFKVMETESKHICITRPRRFGQTQGRMMKSIHILNITWMMSEMILH